MNHLIFVISFQTSKSDICHCSHCLLNYILEVKPKFINVIITMEVFYFSLFLHSMWGHKNLEQFKATRPFILQFVYIFFIDFQSQFAKILLLRWLHFPILMDHKLGVILSLRKSGQFFHYPHFNYFHHPVCFQKLLNELPLLSEKGNMMIIDQMSWAYLRVSIKQNSY